MPAIGRMTGLRELFLSRKITDDAMAPLANLKELESIEAFSIGDKGLAYLGKLANLKEMHRVKGVTDEGLRNIVGMTALSAST